MPGFYMHRNLKNNAQKEVFRASIKGK